MREISAGGVVLRRMKDAWWMAAVELPPKEDDRPRKVTSGATQAEDRSTKHVAEEASSALNSTAPDSSPNKSTAGMKPVLTLPKGLLDPGETPLETALREVREETGITADLVTKLGDVKYVYVRSWGDGARVFKIVSFYLMRYRSGQIDEIDPEMRIEVARALWIRLEDAPKLLAYKGEKDMARRALEHASAHPDL